MNVLETRLNALRKQVQNVTTFLTEPVGVFEFLDNTIKTFRQANKQTLSQLNVKLPLSGQVSYRGQLLNPELIDKIRVAKKLYEIRKVIMR